MCSVDSGVAPGAGWSAFLRVDPLLDVGQAVDHAPAEAEAARARAPVTPVAQCRYWRPDDARGFGDGDQFVFGCGHCEFLSGGFELPVT